VLVSIFTSHDSGSALVKQLDKQHSEALHFTVYYPSLHKFTQQAGEGKEGFLWVPLEFFPHDSSLQTEFTKKVKDTLKVEATYDRAFGYDALYNLVECLSKAGSVQPEEVVKALAQLDRKGILSRPSLLHVGCNRVQHQ
jgi:ABC-type branched-subunit amino acid transport system substrate-binding protein